MYTVVIIPTYNERSNITPIIRAVFNLSIPNLGIIVVDDNSPDGTADIVKSLQNEYGDTKLQIIKRSGKLGIGTAYIEGFSSALEQGAQYIFEMDADGSHNPSDIPRLLERAQENTDVVIGSRRVDGGTIVGWNAKRHIASWGAMTVARVVLNLKTRDVTAGFRCYSQHVLRKINLKTIKSNGYAFQEEMIWRCEKMGFRVTEIPITFKDRERGISKLSYKDVIEFFLTIIRLRLYGNK